MAEALESEDRKRSRRLEKKSEQEDHVNSNKEQVSFAGPSIPECAVCLQNCIHPAQLPCGHIFCFLCVKGVANQSKKCAMCRQEIPSDYLEKPQLLDQRNLDKDNIVFDDGYQWFYEGRNGWWQYDERTSRELEMSYKKGERICELLIAGFLYVADFDAMVQLRRNDPSRRRRIKRDLATIPKKGVAGLRLDGSQTREEGSVAGSKSPTESAGSTDYEDGTPPSNTPRTHVTGLASGTSVLRHDESLQQAIEQISQLSLEGDDSVVELSDSANTAETLPEEDAALVLTFCTGDNHL